MNQTTVANHITDQVHPWVFTGRRVVVLDARVAHALLLHCVLGLSVGMDDVVDTTCFYSSGSTVFSYIIKKKYYQYVNGKHDQGTDDGTSGGP